MDLTAVGLKLVAAVPVTTLEMAPANTWVFDERRSSLSIAAWIGVACGGIAFLALVTVISIIIVRRRRGEGDFTAL